MLTPFGMNVGLAVLCLAGDARDLLDVLGQGRGDLYMANCFASLRRSWGDDAAAENHLYRIASVLPVVALAMRHDKRISFDKGADLVSFIIERGMHMPKEPS